MLQSDKIKDNKKRYRNTEKYSISYQKCRDLFPMKGKVNLKCRKNPKHLTVLGRYEIMSAQETSKLSQKNSQAQGGSAKSYEEKKMGKDDKIMMHYCKVSLGEKAM